ncbi:MAG TPA: PQQ-binding-like beta-propeller repeat protein [Planctomycetaceae bacterium]|nr:PQQ-binding-like beta-propeller repeat protein [Planctomycetaceae bacterium]
MNRFLLPVAVIATLLASSALSANDWPQWLGPERDGVWRETGLIAQFPKEGPKIRWRVPIGSGYSGPAVVGDRVYVMDRQKRTGDATKPAGSRGRSIPGNERVLCLSATDGKIIWKHEYDCPYTISYSSGPRCTPLIRDGRVYALGAMGDLTVLDAADGHLHWAKNLAHEFNVKVPFWGFAAHPLLDGDLLYCIVGGKGTAVVALNKTTGTTVWKSLDTVDTGYSPPMLYEFGGKKQLIVWLSEALYGLDPATGKQLWKHAYPDGVPMQRPAVNIITVKKVDDLLFISTFYHGPMMLKVEGDKATMVWKGQSANPGKPDGAHCLMASPVFKDGYGYAVGSVGDLHCFKAKTHENVWETFAAVTGRKAECGTVFLVPQGDHFVLFNDQGDLILADLTPKGYHEISRAHILEPVEMARGRNIVWSHPAFADRCVFARNEKEMVCVSLAQAGTKGG